MHAVISKGYRASWGNANYDSNNRSRVIIRPKTESDLRAVVPNRCKREDTRTFLLPRVVFRSSSAFYDHSNDRQPGSSESIASKKLTQARFKINKIEYLIRG